MHKYGFLNRIIIKLDPNLFSLDLAEQERARSLLLDEHRIEIENLILAEIFNQTGLKESRDLFNSYRAYLVGIGENRISMPGHVDKGSSLIDFKNILQFDQEYFKYHQDMMSKDFPNLYKEQPYSIFLPGFRAHFFVDNVFHYANISSLAGHILNTVCDLSDVIINSLFPIVTSYGKNHGKKVDKGIILSLRNDRNGLDIPYKQIKKEAKNYLIQLEKRLIEKFELEPSRSYIIPFVSDVPDEDDLPSITETKKVRIILGNSSALSSIKFESFMRDVLDIQDHDLSDISEIVKSESLAIKQFITNKHQEIMVDYKENIISLPRDQEVIMSEESFIKTMEMLFQ